MVTSVDATRHGPLDSRTLRLKDPAFHVIANTGVLGLPSSRSDNQSQFTFVEVAVARQLASVSLVPDLPMEPWYECNVGRIALSLKFNAEIHRVWMTALGCGVEALLLFLYLYPESSLFPLLSTAYLRKTFVPAFYVMPAQTTDAEVLIVGAGPVGLFTALRLGQAGISVTVLERDSGLSQLPRACMFYPQVQFALDEADVYNDLIKKGGGFRTTGLDIRLPPLSDGNGGKKPGQLVASFPKEDAIGFNPEGSPRAPMDGTPAISMLNIPQSQMCQVLMSRAIGTGHVRVLFSRELISVESDGSGEGDANVSIGVKDLTSNTESRYTASFLIGADGSKSKTRSLLGIPFPGHTWPERLVATDVWLSNENDGPITTTLLMDPVHYTVLSPLTPPIRGELSKWRVTFALNPEDLKTMTDEDFLTEGYIAQHYDRSWVGPHPLSYKIDRRATYTVHQRLAANLKKGRCLLAGDAAHVNNVIGGLGLSNSLLDSVALSDALIMVLREGKPADPVLTMYSDERRQVFQFFIDPVSSWSKLRIQSGEADDWFFRCLNDTSSPSFARYIDTLENSWPTHIRETAKLL
ncbi:hypothetical protein CHU98_g1041 [Xylaria longipes]|nr:hypothetical protein CHU98_g1041 [Xylaria longipes]